MEQAIWEKELKVWIQTQREYLQTLNPKQLLQWKKCYHKERTQHLETCERINSIKEEMKYCSTNRKIKLRRKYREALEHKKMMELIKQRKAEDILNHWKKNKTMKPFFHIPPEEQLLDTEEEQSVSTTHSKKTNKPMRTKEELEEYFANLVLKTPQQDEDNESHTSQEQETYPPTTPMIPDLFDYMSTFTDEQSTTTNVNTQDKSEIKSSSSSSSSSSSDDSSTTSGDSSISGKTKKSKKKKKRRTKKHQKKYTKLFNKLCKSASHHKLQILKLDGTPKDKRRSTVLWIETIKDILSTDSKTSHILEHYPTLPNKLQSYVNKALGSFLRAQMAHHVKNMLSGVNEKDGLGILLRIQQIYAPASIKDRNNALTALNALQMHPKETVVNFVQRFRRALKQLQDVSQHIKPPPESELINLLIGKCLDAIPQGEDVRNTLLFYDRLMTHHIPSRNKPVPFTLSALEADLCQHETHLARSPTTKTYQKPNKPNNYKANSTSKFQRKIECLKCKGPHKLMQCRKATTQEKKDLWEEYKKTWTTNKQKKEQANANTTTKSASPNKQPKITRPTNPSKPMQ